MVEAADLPASRVLIPPALSSRGRREETPAGGGSGRLLAFAGFSGADDVAGGVDGSGRRST